MKKYILIICVIVLGFYTYAQNNVIGKKITAIDSVVTSTIVGESGTKMYIKAPTGSGNGLVIQHGSSTDMIELGGASASIGIKSNSNFNLTTVSNVGSITVDNINIDGNTITNTDSNGNLTITANGTGILYLESLGINGGNIVSQSNSGSTNISGGIAYNPDNALIGVLGQSNPSGADAYISIPNVSTADILFQVGLTTQTEMANDGTWDFKENDLNGVASISNTNENVLDISSDTTIVIDSDSTIFNTGDVVINDNLNVEGSIYRNGGDLTINDDVVANGYYTSTGTQSVPHDTNTTFITMTSSDIGAWVAYGDFDDGTTAAATMLFFVRRGDFNIVLVSKNGSGGIDLTSSGANVQLYQNSGSTKTLRWSLIKISGL